MTGGTARISTIALDAQRTKTGDDRDNDQRQRYPQRDRSINPRHDDKGHRRIAGHPKQLQNFADKGGDLGHITAQSRDGLAG